MGTHDKKAPIPTAGQGAHPFGARRLLVGAVLASAVGFGLLFSIASTSAGAAPASGALARMASGSAATVASAAVMVSATSRVPNCVAGEAPVLDIANYPRIVAGGATSPVAAVRAVGSAIDVSAAPFSAAGGAPVWLTAGGETFIATVLPDGTWFASRATFVGCKSHNEIYKR
jgi:hypothetical protein